MRSIKTFIKRLISRTGYSISKIPEIENISNINPYSKLPKNKQDIVDLEKISAVASGIPGMINTSSGKLMYILCYFQLEKGDVVEIGSWQGRSSSFLARATTESKNGKFFAIDHFKGNVGKEHYYVVKENDLSDLKRGFIENMSKIDLANNINLMDMPNDVAVKYFSKKSIRFLFIDGDHTSEGVKKDIDLFFPLLVDGALIIFDDYSKRFPGLLHEIDELLSKNKYSRVMTYPNTIVLKYSDKEFT